MIIADNIIKDKIKNVYFIWGRGKTTIANELNKKFGCHIYSTDDSRYRHMKSANPEYQPYMCRDFEKEYGVKSFWELPPGVISDRERHWLHEFTPMVIMDLILLAPAHDVIICEGDIEYDTIIPVASHTVHLSNRGTRFDWFNRPDHIDALNSIKNRTDLTEEEKEYIIKNAYNSVGQNEGEIPDWVIKHGVKDIEWNDSTSIEQTTLEVAQYFKLPYA